MTDWRTRNARALLREFQEHGLASGVRLRRYAGQDLTGETFAPDEDLTGADFREADLTDAQLPGARLTGADLRGATLTSATLDGADLTGADLTGARLDRASLIGADLTGARVAGAQWDLARLTGARLPADAAVTGWGTATPGLLPRLQIAPGESCTAVAWHPTRPLLATACGHSVLLWDVVTGKATATLTGHQGWVRALAYSPDGTQLATAADDAVHLWDTATNTHTATLTSHQGLVQALAYSPDGTQLATAADDAVHLWDTATNTHTATLTTHQGTVWSAAYSPDGTQLATAGSDAVRLWDTAVRGQRDQSDVTLLSLRTGGWARFHSEYEDEYELHGEPDGSFWWSAGLCRFEPGELDGYGVRNVARERGATGRSA